MGRLSPEFVHRLEHWHLAPGLVTAAELVEVALVQGQEGKAVDAARRLIATDLNAAPLIRAQAATVLIRTDHADEVPLDL